MESTTWKPVPENERLGVVIYNFQHDGQYSLKLDVGDTVHNISEEECWYFGFSLRNRALKGIYPKNYIKIQESKIEKTAIGEHVTSYQPPVIQEVTSVLREWGQLARDLYVSHNKTWKTIYHRINELIAHRSKILSGTLTLDELRELRQIITSRIDFGNNILNLDLVVRDSLGNIINPETASVVRLYREHELASQRLKKLVSGNDSTTTPKPSKNKTIQRHVHMLFVAVRNFVCRVGEDAELLMCLYDVKEWKSLTENYVVRWSKQGLTQNLDLLGNLHVLFTDLGNRDLNRERIYLVCNVVRVGNMEVRDDVKRGTTLSRRTISAAPSVSTYECLRRPCGIAAMDVTDYLNGSRTTDEEKQHFIQFIPCGDRESMDNALRRLTLSREISHKDHKGQGLWISMRLLHGDLKQVTEEYPGLVVGNVALARKLGFPEIILPGDVRHDLYLTLVCGEFSRGSKSADKNVEVTVRVCNGRGQPIPGVIHLGGSSEALNEFRSVVYYHEDKPKWNETFKIAIPIEEFYHSHLKFTFRHRSSNETKDRTEKPFALSFVKLMQDNGTTLLDTNHELLVYKLDHRKFDENDTAYLKLPSTRSELTDNTKPSAVGLVMNNKDSLTISTCLCSTKLTQNVDLLGLLKYQSHPDQLHSTLTSLMKINGEEVVKFLPDVLDALFSILMRNSDASACDRLVFECLVTIIGLVTDRKYEHFKPVLDVYIKENFSATLAYQKLLTALEQCLEMQVHSKVNGDDQLRVMKSVHYVIRFVVRSRQLFSALNGNEGQDEFQTQLESLFSKITHYMKRSEDLVLLAQGACLKYLPNAIPDLISVVDPQQLSRSLREIINSIPSGRLNNQKMMTMNDIVHSNLFRLPECRAILLPMMIDRIKDLLIGTQEVEVTVTLLCDIMDVLHSGDIGSTHNDVADIMMRGLRTIIQTVISMDKEEPVFGQLVAVMVSIFRQMTPHHYRNYLGHFPNKSELLDFLIEILVVFKDLVASRVYPSDWAQMILLQNSVLLKALRFFSHTIRDSFSNPFEYQVWNNYFHCAVAFITQPALQMESFSQSKRRQVLGRYRDMRRDMGFEIRTMWFNLGQHKIHFVPAMVGPFLEMTLLPETELRKATLPIFFDMMQCEYYSPRHQGDSYSGTKHDSSNIKGNFSEVENTMIAQLDALVEGGRGDEHYKDLFNSILSDFCEKHSTLREQGLKFVRTVTRLIERLLEYRSIITDENRENRMSCTVNLLDFYNEIGRKEMYIRYLNKLCDLHLECDNFTEAAYTLQLHAHLLQWSDESLPSILRTSRHPNCSTHRQLKETLYLDSIEYFDRGKMWECALTLCKELAQQYEEEIFDYAQLSALLTKMATLYDNIIKQLRPEPEYFRVAFYGRGFPAFLQNKMFVYRGKEYERLSDFTNRIQLQFPNAEIMNRLTPPDRDIMDSPQQYLQINKVIPIMEDQERFSNKIVSEQILRFYRVNRVQQFNFSRPFHRGSQDSENTFSSLWLERTLLTTSCPLPGILRWFPVTQSRVIEISPLETAIETMEATNRQLTELILAHKADPQLPLHPLTMKLNGIVDAAVNGGIANYEEAFFTNAYLQDHPEDERLVGQLRELFALQIPLIEAAIQVHRLRCNDSMLPLQERIEMCFADMRNHVEEKYGKRAVDPHLERQMALLLRSNSNRLSAGSGSAPISRLSNSSNDALDHGAQPPVPHPRNTSLSGSLASGYSVQKSLTSHIRQTSTSSLFVRNSTQTLSSLSFSLSSTPATPSMSPVKMLTTGRFRDRTSKSNEKKIRDREVKSHRDSFRRLSSGSLGRSPHFPSLSLAFGINSSSGPSSPVVQSSSNLGCSSNSLDGLLADSGSSVITTNPCNSEAPSSPVIELTQQLTSKRPLRSEVRRSSTVTRSMNGDGLCSSSQNSIESTISSSSDDIPPPLPAKQNTTDYSNVPPEKPALNSYTLFGIKEDTPPPPPPPKKPSRPLPPKV